jgi:CRISPR-associated exonuclease Cas4
MTKLSDEENRIRALTDLDATLLVEAAAGTGKTSLLAGRVLILLSSSVPPRAIAAITFTEFAAGELRERITRFLDELLAGQVPVELKLGFPEGVTEAQRNALADARGRLDELACTTIHGFCHNLLRTYAVEAAIDPGAEILDRVQADLAFGSIFERWLRQRLDKAQAIAGPIAVVAQHDPTGAEELLRDFAEFRRAHRTARPPSSIINRTSEIAFTESVAEFRRWFGSVEGPRVAEEDINQLEQLTAYFRRKFDPLPNFDRLWELAHPPRVAIMRARGFELQRYQRWAAWRRMRGPAAGARLADEAAAHYDRCAQAFRELIGSLATAIVSVFSAEIDELLDDFEKFKRSAAVLDFDDLLYITRDVLRRYGKVQRAAAARFTRILVDEFQDTDPIQAEIVFLLTGSGDTTGRWHDRPLLPGRLFMVGDPKQAIYRFRGADIATYRQARDAVERQFPGNVLRVASNFRSRAAILRHINHCFRAPLEAQEAGYVELESTRGDAEHWLPCVAKIKVDIIPQTRVDDIRDEEARIVAETCARLIGNVVLRRSASEGRLLTPGDIALLAPTGTELWRYERALEEVGLPFSSQAGKNLFRRQEAQDLVALVRALADFRDTVALGALLRGPVVGLTEQELLEIADSLPSDKYGAQHLSLRTDPAIVQHVVAREALTILRDLRLRVRSTAPSLLIAEAVERLRIRAILVARSADQASRALANADAILERARAYGVRGFRQFARDLDADWSRRASYAEGVVDAEGQSIEIVTIHSSKGLEWPVVIPINTASGPRPPDQFVHRRSDDTLHWVLGDIVPPSLAEAMRAEGQEASHERLRLLYVACTRAMELLVLPELSWTDDAAWMRALDFKLEEVPELDVSQFVKKPFKRTVDRPNEQTADVFAAERMTIDEAFPRIRWIRPSDGDPDLVQFQATPATAWEQPVESAMTVQGGSLRGVILHKLMEEFLTGELEESAQAVERRCALLVRELASSDEALPDLNAEEVATTALRTISLPELCDDRANVTPEVPVYGSIATGMNRLVSGRADAVRYRNGGAEIVFDWKSDVRPEPAQRATYARQLAQYVHVLGAKRGAIVYMTTGEIQWVDPVPAAQLAS